MLRQPKRAQLMGQGDRVGDGARELLSLDVARGHVQERTEFAAREMSLGAEDAVGGVNTFSNGALALVMPCLFQTDATQGGVKGRNAHGGVVSSKN